MSIRNELLFIKIMITRYFYEVTFPTLHVHARARMHTQNYILHSLKYMHMYSYYVWWQY